jgi:hypothetical protein
MRLIPLTEAFRAVVRAWYPARPALADEIQNEDYFRSPFDKSMGWRLNPEVQIADFAYAELKDAIINQQVRLRGRRETKDDAEDIDPTEIKRTGILIFNNAVDRWQPTTRVSQFKQLPIYLNVHCYADEIAALIGTPTAPSPGVTKDKQPPVTPNDAARMRVEACRPLIEAPGASNMRRADLLTRAQNDIPGLLVLEFDEAWETYASEHQRARGRRPRQTA